MERSWSDEARAALEAYPWRSPGERARAAREAELVAFGDQVEAGDLPLEVRQWLRRHPETAGGYRYRWNGESWGELIARFTHDILAQALAANGGNAAAAARALKTSPRIVAYNARKCGLRD